MATSQVAILLAGMDIWRRLIIDATRKACCIYVYTAKEFPYEIRNNKQKVTDNNRNQSYWFMTERNIYER